MHSTSREPFVVSPRVIPAAGPQATTLQQPDRNLWRYRPRTHPCSLYPASAPAGQHSADAREGSTGDTEPELPVCAVRPQRNRRTYRSLCRSTVVPARTSGRGRSPLLFAVVGRQLALGTDRHSIRHQGCARADHCLPLRIKLQCSQYSCSAPNTAAVLRIQLQCSEYSCSTPNTAAIHSEDRPMSKSRARSERLIYAHAADRTIVPSEGVLFDHARRRRRIPPCARPAPTRERRGRFPGHRWQSLCSRPRTWCRQDRR